MKKRVMAALLVCIMGALTACKGGGSTETAAPSKAVQEQAGDKITVKIGTTVSENNPTAVALELFKKTAAEKSEGRIDVQIFYSSQLGDETEMLAQTRQGDI